MPSPPILMAKVHKSVGFGSAAHCNGDVNDDENQKKNTLQCVNSYRNKDFQCKPISDSKFNLSTFFSTLQELESQLYHAEMARDAYDYMIDLAEQRYHIRVRKNSDAK